MRKAILATNVAEASITIDGVRFVADSGRAKEMLHDTATGGGLLQEGWCGPWSPSAWSIEGTCRGMPLDMSGLAKMHSAFCVALL
jgi:hypothetical protein